MGEKELAKDAYKGLSVAVGGAQSYAIMQPRA